MRNKKIVRGIEITEEIMKELREHGRSHALEFVNCKGIHYLAHFETGNDKIEIVPEARYLEHRCPRCGGRIRITGKGYFCENSLKSHKTCNWHCNGILSHRFILPHEIEAHLDGRPVVLDGCFNSKGKIFSAILVENEKYGMSLTSVVGRCPVCGDDVLVSPVAFNCRGHDEYVGPGHLSLWRHVRGHEVTVNELRQLLSCGMTDEKVLLNAKDGTLSLARLRLSEDCKRIIPDYNVGS